MWPSLRHIYTLGVKELISLRRDPVLLLFVFYALTAQIIIAGEGLSFQVRSASVGIVDEDRSQLSQSIAKAFRPPYFRPAQSRRFNEIGNALETRKNNFVIVIPPKFQADLLAGDVPRVQINADATAVGQAFIGTSYIQQIVLRKVNDESGILVANDRLPFGPRIRVRYNPNLISKWQDALVELIIVITMLTILLPGAALLREREHGTLEHLLAMPVRPGEILFAKFWANSLVLLVGAGISMVFVIQGYFGSPMRGSLLLFLLGTFVYQFSAAGIGILLATVTRSVPQLGLACILVIVPIAFLSGAWMPAESLPPQMKILMSISPLTYYSEFANAVVFRGASVVLLWKQLVAMTAIGAICFCYAMMRLRAHLTIGRV
jgi:ABC-2 type transport system permease protein